MRKNSPPATFLDLLEKKGIISSGSSNTEKRQEKSLTLGDLFKEVLKDITTDPEIRKKRERSVNSNPVPEPEIHINTQPDPIHQRKIERAEKQRKREQERAHREFCGILL